VTSTVNSVDKSIDPSIAFEWNGILSKATENAHAFTLCLAMQQSALAEPIKIEGAEAPSLSIEAQLKQLNFYRRPKLSSEGVAWTSFDVLGQAINAAHFADARLHLAMHPPPLAQVDNSKKIAEDVVNNCSLGTQKRLAQAYTNALEEDNTLFDEVIENAHQVHAA
jgi:hypothetical protein